MKPRFTRWCLLAAPVLIAACEGGSGRKDVDPKPGGDSPAGAQKSDESAQPVQPAAPPGPIRVQLLASGLPEAGNWKCDPAIADVNHDGHPDFAAHPRLGTGPRVWLGDGAGNWRESSDGLEFGKPSCGTGILIVDVNADTHPDLVVADHCNGLYVFLGDGTGRWEKVVEAFHPDGAAPATDEASRGVECVDAGDLNGDGHVDLVIGSSDGFGLAIVLGDGTGRNWKVSPSTLPSTGWTVRAKLTDVNADGNLDLIASYHRGPRVWLGDGIGGFEPSVFGLPTPMIQGLFSGIDAGDVNGDGRVDLAVANWVDGPEVYLQTAEGDWEKSADVFPDMLGGAFGLDLADIDRDGHLDLVCTGRLTSDVGYVYGVFVLRGDGKGNWTFLRDSGLPTTGLAFTWGVTLADADHDEVLDLAVASGGTVATDLNRSEPVIPARLMVWKTILTSPSARAGE